jgi:hypothetical protein
MKPIVHIYPSHILARDAAREFARERERWAGCQMHWVDPRFIDRDGQETWFRGVTDWHDCMRLAGTEIRELHDHGCRQVYVEYVKRRVRPDCQLPPAGWRCTRQPGHAGPCAAWPT